MKVTIGDFLLKRLTELGIHHIFGVPGDYNLGFLDQVVNNKYLKWVGNCNELNGAYAADGYGRIKGASAVVTTFGVGELSAINGIAGAYAEYVPVIKIVGMPALSTQERKALVHHTLGGGDFTVFAEMYSKVTVAQTLLTELNAALEIDRVLKTAWILKRPVYIGIPTDVSYKEIIIDNESLELSYPQSNPDAVNEAIDRMTSLVTKSKNPVILLDICAIRHPMQQLILNLIDRTGIAFATMNMGKGIINESHPLFLGNYNGDFSTVGVQQRVESSDCILSFGTILSDFNTGGFTANLNVNVAIEMHSNFIKLKHSIYNGLYFTDYIPALIKKLSGVRFNEVVTKEPSKKLKLKNDVLTQKRFWQIISNFLDENSIVIAEAGTSMFGTLPMPIPDNTIYISQPLWGSIGYTVGSLLGACMAAPDKQSVLFIGDGSFQLTAQELSTMIKQKANPIIFVINNDGYTVERVIHGPAMEYNDINMWKYSELPKIFGDDIWCVKVYTEVELDNAIQELDKRKNKFRLIEVVMDKNDAPEILKKIGMACAEQNKYST